MPQMRSRHDAIIIGSGVSGLICGCFLAKAGMKILLLERHYKPGGYCTSFSRQGFTFDAAAHSFGGIVNGALGGIFDQLELKKKVLIKRFNPSDTVTTPDHSVTFWSELDRTVEEFCSVFPDENAGIQEFFRFLMEPAPLSLVHMRSRTFLDILNRFFTSHKLKMILSFPLLGNAGLPPSKMSAFMGVKILKEFLLDGGYYPEGGMHALSTALAERFKEYGGELRLSRQVKKIETDEKGVIGVTVEHDDFFPSSCVISACDARQTFLELLDRERLDRDFLDRLDTMTQTLSTFILYLGVRNASAIAPHKRNMWFLSHYDLDHAYHDAQEGNFSNIERYLVHAAPEQNTICAYVNAPFKDKQFWTGHKSILQEMLIEKINLHTLPGLANHIIYKGAASPQDLYRYTLNYQGAAFGWETTPFQLALPEIRRPPFIPGLYLTGHWTTHGLGIPGASYLGYDTANLILMKKKLQRRN